MKSDLLSRQRVSSNGRSARGKRVVECLERRMLLSAVVIDRTLFVEGTPRSEVIEIDASGASTKVKFNNRLAGAFANGDFDRIQVNALGGNDTVSLGIAVLTGRRRL